MSKSLDKILPKPQSVGERNWGEETLLVLASGKYSLKKLFIKRGNAGGLQYHRKKDESGYIVSGKLLIRYQNDGGQLEEIILEAGSTFHFSPGTVHQEEALEDTVIIEASTPHFNDRVRVENDFGLKIEGGLSSTSEEEIELR